MSKIGKINISIPEKVKVALAGNILNIEGPLGKKSLNIDLETFNLDIKDGKEISIKPKKIDQNTKRLWGMNRSLIYNAGIKITVEKQTTLKISGVDKQQVGSIVSKLKTLRKIEPYKGKGVREKGQHILKKEGKKK